MAENDRYYAHEEPPGTPMRFVVLAGSTVFGNVTVDHDVIDGEPVLVLTHVRGHSTTVKADAVTSMVKYVGKSR